YAGDLLPLRRARTWSMRRRIKEFFRQARGLPDTQSDIGGGRWRGLVRSRVGVGHKRKAYLEAASVTELALHGNRPSARGCDPLHDGKPESETRDSLGRVPGRAKERFEHAGQVLGGDSASRVSDRERGKSFVPRDCDINRCAGWTVLACVIQ